MANPKKHPLDAYAGTILPGTRKRLPARKPKAVKPVMAWCETRPNDGSIVVVGWSTGAGPVRMLACFPTRRDARKWSKASGLAVERVEVRR